MKKLLLLLILAFTFVETHASHVAGGEIWYEYAGDSQNPHRYDVFVLLYRDVGGVAAPSSLTICISSTCFSLPDQTAPILPFTLKPGSDTILGPLGSIVTPNSNLCVNSTSALTQIYRYYAQVDLPGTCQDIRFSCALPSRNNSTNLLGSGNLYVDAALNSMQGNNSSPRFLTPAVRSFCIGQPFTWSQAAIEPDGDSLYYSLGITQSGTCTSPLPINFAPGYSQSSPMTTSNGITLNSRTGLMSFTPAQQEVVVINVKITEYRYNSSFGIWLLVGYSLRDLQVPISANCSPIPANWVQQPMSAPGVPRVACGDSIIRLRVQKRFLGSSLAPDGSDFALYNSQGKLLRITGAGVDAVNGQTIEAKSFWLKLQDSIYYNDSLVLTARTGNDLNTLLNICNQQLPPGDTIPFVVTSCNTAISVDEMPANPQMHLYPNPVANILTVKLPASIGSGKLVVYDLKGNEVTSEDFTTTEPEIQLEFLPAGMYILKATTDNWSEVIKFSKE